MYYNADFDFDYTCMTGYVYNTHTCSAIIMVVIKSIILLSLANNYMQRYQEREICNYEVVLF